MSMDPELKRALDEIHLLAKDNHRLLRAVRHHQFLEMFGKFIVYLVLILLVAGLYLGYVAPLMRQFAPSGTASSTASGFSLPSFAQLQKLISSYQVKSK